jgi:hypothetical protein
MDFQIHALPMNYLEYECTLSELYQTKKMVMDVEKHSAEVVKSEVNYKDQLLV